MLNSETKRHIDAARDVLVGVAPNPTTQIDQITYALIYKFMDDMDQAAIKAGGNPSFFIGDLEPYAWSKLSNSRMGNQEKMNLYSEALTKFSEAKQLPELFRTIFKAAFLPYRSPETLGLFLKEISYFDYSHPEELGNAYEYLLSIMSSQGDAGQFRTPRHIIDFIVDVLNPTKDDKVLDPSCGTAGFLVSTYNHILKQHDGKDDPKKKEKPLTPDERKKLMQNLQGYDIDPTMVRIAQVNMYLHQFKNPQIFQYDTLTSEERWNEKFDVILANPPFMTPKGGIKPHNKFSIQSNRAEVLFVDYIVNHLKPKGRAGIVVPEGIIFQTGTAYKTLRKNLVEDCLVGVISLPSGVFQPYSGVKTSILILNKELNQKSDSIFFAKIENDGFSLGGQRTPISANDLPSVISDFCLFAETQNTNNSALVKKDEIIKQNEISLSVSHYLTSSELNTDYETVSLGEVCSFQGGSQPPKSVFVYEPTEGYDRFIQIRDFNDDKNVTYIPKSNKNKYCESDDVLIGRYGASVGRICRGLAGAYNVALIKTIPSEGRLLKSYLYYLLNSKKLQDFILAMSQRAAQAGVNPKHLEDYLIPLPPLEVQDQIVAELDGYAAIISGAKQIVENWKPKISIDPSWEQKILGDICEVYQPKTITGDEILETGPHKVYGANGVIGFYDKFNHPDEEVAVTCRGATCGTVNFTEPNSWITGNAMVISPKDKMISKKFLLYLLCTTDLGPTITGSAQPQITGASLKPFKIPIPPIDEQSKIVDLIEMEKNDVEAAVRLIKNYEARTQAAIAKLWNE
jgi:type I restriction enzyme M protein